jgi:hypothetical protein
MSDGDGEGEQVRANSVLVGGRDAMRSAVIFQEARASAMPAAARSPDAAIAKVASLLL